ncbi:MAG: S8 family serine peptidase, partial [Myxococcota bacterium]
MSKLLHLKREIFDPTRESAAPMERALRATPEQKLHILQFAGSSNAAKKAELKGLGVEFCRYIPDDAFVVRLSPRAKSAVESNPHVRALMPLHPAYKMPDTMAEQVLVPSNTSIPSNYDVVSPDPADKARLEQQIKQLGGEVVHPENGSLLLVASLTPSQLSKLVRLDTVSWVEPSTEIEVDMDNALIQGGAQAVQDKTGGYTGRGIVGHVLEGIDRNHPDFAANEFRDAPIAVADGRSTGHGTNTYGQIFGSGKGNEKARGIIPDAQGVYTNYNAVRNAQPGNTPNSRYELTERVMKDHNVMFQTASWGYARTTQYNARSAEMDQLIFDLDLPICQSQSNAGTRDSRPQAWAKNIISGGALRHQDNPDPTDDSWSGGASIGPASDGRIKPTLSGYYDRITTTSPGG